jgi:glycosyltransferase involved in cell wall biosynthesis
MNQESLPIHFFTIVLDGQPYIRYHIDIFNSLKVPWHWHIVEGVASLTHDTSWGAANGGKVPPNQYPQARSVDGTSEYIDELARLYPTQVTVHRKPPGTPWDGKIEMVRAPLALIKGECLLWQVDSDELWTAEQIHTMHSMFLAEPARHAAWFWCQYFVGPDRVITTRNCYAENPSFEWLRVWRFKPAMQWISHEPPTLAVDNGAGRMTNVGQVHPFTHVETEAAGLVFQHMSYTTEAQVRFKETYYGYQGAVEKWKALQRDTNKYVLLRNYFPWVKDSTIVESANARGIRPLLQPDQTTQSMRPTQPIRVETQIIVPTPSKPRIAIDGVFFQLNSTGIARVWSSILERWAQMGHSDEVLLIDRDGTMPKFPGFRYRSAPRYHVGQGPTDEAALQTILNEEGAALFASTYHTSVPHTQSLMMIHDMIPEVFKWNLNEPVWIEKHRAISRAKHFVCGSQNTLQDFRRFYAAIPADSCEVILNGIDSNQFKPASTDEILNLHSKYSITKPYFLMVGSGDGYKNSKMLIEALNGLPSGHGFEVILVTHRGIPLELLEASTQGVVRALSLSDDELRAAYSGAVAFIYPSLYEGFGLPILEAMACNCPVITNTTASLPEVAGEAALYAADAKTLADMLCEIQKPGMQQRLVAAGRARVRLFSWDTSAEKLWSRVVALTEYPAVTTGLRHITFAQHLL